MTTEERSLRSGDFPVHWPVLTRWTDNDMFGHLNNAVYYALFDTAINGWINTTTGTDPLTAPWLGVVAESGCRYYAELRFPPDPLVVGLAVTRLGAHQRHLSTRGVPVAARPDRFRRSRGRGGRALGACVRRPRHPPPPRANSRRDPRAAANRPGDTSRVTQDHRRVTHCSARAASPNASRSH